MAEPTTAPPGGAAPMTDPPATATPTAGPASVAAPQSAPSADAAPATAVVTPTPPAEPGGLLDAFDPGAIPAALTVVIATVLLVRLTRRGFESLSERVVHHRLAIKQTSALVAFVLYAGSIVVAFDSLFVLSPQVVLALSGTLAVTVGFGLKDVAASFLAGILILINKPFQVGDRISFGSFYGEVTEIGLRTVRLVTLDDNLVTIPNGKFLTDEVASANAGALDCMVVMTYHVDPRADHQRAKEIVEDAVLASKYLYLGKPVAVLLGTELTERGGVIVSLNAKAYVYDTRHEKAFASDVTDRVLTAFRKHGIELPGSASFVPGAGDRPAHDQTERRHPGQSGKYHNPVQYAL